MTIWCKTPEVLDALITLRALVPGRAEKRFQMGLRTGRPTWLCRPHPREGMGPMSDQAAGVRSRSNFRGFEGKECSLPFLPFWSECHASSLLEYSPFASRVVVTVQPTVSGIRHMWSVSSLF